MREASITPGPRLNTKQVNMNSHSKVIKKTENLKIESGTQPNSILKIKSQGLPNQNSNRRGDLFVHLVVEIPKKLSKQQKSLLDEFRKSD